MNKLKEMTTALREHLNRDERGKTLLADVERVANEQRKELAAEKERTESLARSLQIMTSKFDEQLKCTANAMNRAEAHEAARKQACSDRATLAQQLDDALAKIASLQPCDIELIEIQKRSPPRLRRSLGVNNDATGQVIDPKKLASMFNQLRKDMRVSPVPVAPKSGKILSYLLDDIISDTSVDQLITLGRFVACRALFNVPCSIVSDVTIGPDKYDSDSIAPFVSWLRRSIDTKSVAKYCLPRTAKTGVPIT